MKIKFDFVTNSSSTSFTGYGIKIKYVPESLWHPIYDYFKKSDRYHNMRKIECFEEFVLSTINEIFYDFIEDHKLIARYCCETEEIFIGLYARGQYNCRTGEYIYEDCSSDINIIKEIFELMFKETNAVDFKEFCNKIEYIDKEWYE